MEFVIIIVIVSYLRKSLRTAQTMPEWNKRLLWIMYGAICLLAMQGIIPGFEQIGDWLGIASLGALLYVIYKQKEFEEQKFLITALLPLLAASLFKDAVMLISRSFYNEWKTWIDAAGTFAVVWAIGAWVVTRKQRRELINTKKKAYEEEQNNKVIREMKAQLEIEVAERTAELRKQKDELENTLTELKAAQAQLIQSEKMASLGELTAGIAHEIQNPLNFVNNFSEVSNELIDEMNEELGKGDIEEAKAIALDIKQNLEKINHHGKRADGIVKGMLQHSRKSAGQKEPADINALCDEYLRLSYHGLRAKDKTFNAKFETDFDAGIGKINIVPQEMGRVILNLINNAFYAVGERQKAERLKQHAGYEPTVIVKTSRLSASGRGAVLISVKDNGSGIPQSIIDKIFQPFFTTKPTGEGTGLGLSLSYDIVKAHGGEITVSSAEGEGTEFEIELPVA